MLVCIAGCTRIVTNRLKNHSALRKTLFIRIVAYCIKLPRNTTITKSMLCPRIRAKMPQGETCQLETHLVNKMVTSWNIPGVNIPGERLSSKVTRQNMPKESTYSVTVGIEYTGGTTFPWLTFPGRRLPDQYDRPWACTVTAVLCIFALHLWSVTVHKFDRSVLSVSTARIDCWYRVNNGQHRPLIC